MPYVPNADNENAPLDTEYASTAAAEFRTLKAKVNDLFKISDIDPADNTIYTKTGFGVINVGGGAQQLPGFIAAVNRTAGNNVTFGGLFAADIGPSLTTGVVTAFVGRSSTSTVDSQCGTLTGIQGKVTQRDPDGQTWVFGLRSSFANRFVDGVAVPDIGADLHNHHSIAIQIDSQRRSSAGEKCGWSRGIRFEDYSLDEDDLLDYGVAIDFTGLGLSDAANGTVPFELNGVNVETGAFTNLGAVVMPTICAGWWRISVNGIRTWAIPIFSV